MLAILKSSCHDYSIKSSTDFAHYYLWLFSTLWRNTSHPFQNLQKIPTPPPPHTSPFSKCKCHVTFPYFYFHFKETACSSNFKEAQIPVDFSVPTKQVLTGVEHKLREKGRWLHWHSSPISPTAPARLLYFFLQCTIYEVIGIPNYVFPPPFFMSFIPPGRSDINKIGLMAYFLVHWLMLIFS